ncbi:MAG: MFS transporter [Acidocella sp.]|nr:MFS transporter [Acidocella sp.]
MNHTITMKATLSEKTPARAFAILGLLFVFQTINFFDKLAFGVSAVSIMHEFALTPKQFGLIGAVFFLFFAIGGTAIALSAVGRFSTKTILLLLGAIWTVAQFPVYFSHSLTVLIICRMLLGIGEGAALATAMTAAYEWFAPERRNLPSAIILQGISAGFLIGGPFLSAFVVNFGWHSAFLVCGLLSLVWMALFAAIARPGPLAPEGQMASLPRPLFLPGRVLWLDSTVIGCMLIAFFGYWVIGMSAVWLPPYLRVALGYKPQDAGWIISAIYVVQSPVLLFGGWLTQRMRAQGWSARLCLGVSSAVTMLVSGVAMIAAVFSPVGALQTALLAIAFSVPSLTTIFGPVILAAVAPDSQRNKLVIVILSATSISAFFATFINGWIIGSFPGDPHTGYQMAFSLGGVMLLLGAVAGAALLFPERTIARFARIGESRNAR